LPLGQTTVDPGGNTMISRRVSLDPPELGLGLQAPTSAAKPASTTRLAA